MGTSSDGDGNYRDSADSTSGKYAFTKGDIREMSSQIKRLRQAADAIYSMFGPAYPLDRFLGRMVKDPKYAQLFADATVNRATNRDMPLTHADLRRRYFVVEPIRRH